MSFCEIFSVLQVLHLLQSLDPHNWSLFLLLNRDSQNINGDGQHISLVIHSYQSCSLGLFFNVVWIVFDHPGLALRSNTIQLFCSDVLESCFCCRKVVDIPLLNRCLCNPANLFLWTVDANRTIYGKKSIFSETLSNFWLKISWRIKFCYSHRQTSSWPITLTIQW